MKKLVAVLSLSVIALSLSGCKANLKDVKCVQTEKPIVCYDSQKKQTEYSSIRVDFTVKSDLDAEISVKNVYVFDNNVKYEALYFCHILDGDNNDFWLLNPETKVNIEARTTKDVKIIFEAISEDATLYFNDQVVEFKE